jgi:hypothetical protein
MPPLDYEIVLYIAGTVLLFIGLPVATVAVITRPARAVFFAIWGLLFFLVALGSIFYVVVTLAAAPYTVGDQQVLVVLAPVACVSTLAAILAFRGTYRALRPEE